MCFVFAHFGRGVGWTRRLSPTRIVVYSKRLGVFFV